MTESAATVFQSHIETFERLLRERDALVRKLAVRPIHLADFAKLVRIERLLSDDAAKL